MGPWATMLLMCCATAHDVSGALMSSEGMDKAKNAVAVMDAGDISGNCEAFYALRDDLQKNLFHYECGDLAHRAIRLAFHDAIGYSMSGAYAGGGADGSIITFASIELACAANTGLDENVNELRPFLAAYSFVTPGDLVQFAAAIALTNCPGAPRIEFFAGRPPAKEAAGDGSVPTPADSTSVQLERFKDVGLNATEVVHLIAAHSIAHARTTDPSNKYAAFDSTPSTFDSQFYLEVLLKGDKTPGNGTLGYGETGDALGKEGEVRIMSDYNLAHDERTACIWQSMIDNQIGMMTGFAEAMAKLAVVGQDKSKLIDCSDAVPLPMPFTTLSAQYPVGMGHQDVQQTCNAQFPRLKTKSEIR